MSQRMDTARTLSTKHFGHSFRGCESSEDMVSVAQWGKSGRLQSIWSRAQELGSGRRLSGNIPEAAAKAAVGAAVCKKIRNGKTFTSGRLWPTQKGS